MPLVALSVAFPEASARSRWVTVWSATHGLIGDASESAAHQPADCPSTSESWLAALNWYRTGAGTFVAVDDPAGSDHQPWYQEPPGDRVPRNSEPCPSASSATGYPIELPVAGTTVRVRTVPWGDAETTVPPDVVAVHAETVPSRPTVQ